MPTGADWKDGFLFLGNHAALDFLNTRPVLNEEPVELLPDFAALLRWFRAAGWLDPARAADTARASHTAESARELRERLRKDILRYEAGGGIQASTIAELNRLMAEHPMGARVKAERGAFTMERYCDPRKPEDLLGPLALSAAELLSCVERGKIRKCKQCVLHFYDTSKKGTRQWCSMRFCGNRAKVAAYAARKRPKRQ
jgi:predicted RNA-binding Zn ribbon-like protein